MSYKDYFYVSIMLFALFIGLFVTSGLIISHTTRLDIHVIINMLSNLQNRSYLLFPPLVLGVCLLMIGIEEREKEQRVKKNESERKAFIQT